jgi:GTPase involved in cell partitioning and DNA repair
MSFFRHLKNVINNRDYFYNKRKEINEYELIKLEVKKYKENIANRENIIERNYKNLNIYQNNRYNNNHLLFIK